MKTKPCIELKHHYDINVNMRENQYARVREREKMWKNDTCKYVKKHVMW